jgi:hypothetical protein
MDLVHESDVVTKNVYALILAVLGDNATEILRSEANSPESLGSSSCQS